MTTNFKVGMGVSHKETSIVQRLIITTEMALKGFMEGINPFIFVFENGQKSMMIQRDFKGDMQWVLCAEEEITQKMSYGGMMRFIQADKEGKSLYQPFCTPKSKYFNQLLCGNVLKEILEIAEKEIQKIKESKFDPTKPFQVKDRGEWKTPKKDVLYIKQTRDGRHALENPDGRIVQVSHIRNVPEKVKNSDNTEFLNINVGNGKKLVVPIQDKKTFHAFVDFSGIESMMAVMILDTRTGKTTMFKFENGKLVEY